MAYDDDDQRFEELPKEWRDQLAKEKKARKEAEEELTALREKDAQRSIADTFKTMGVDPRFARLARVEVPELNEESLKAWIEANSDLVGVQAPPSAQQEHMLPPREDPYRRMATVDRIGSPPVSMDSMSQVESMSAEELLAMMGGGQ